jgi:hypothetical protein
MDTVGFNNPDVRGQAEQAVQQIAAAGGLIVLDWHQRTFSPREYPAAVEIYGSIIRAAQSQDAWIATMGQVADHWKSQSD